jgi:steroid delta-isomerase-like uncharacterized protein
MLRQILTRTNVLLVVLVLSLIATGIIASRSIQAEMNKTAYRRFMEEAFNGQQFERISNYMAADMVEHTPGLSPGAAGVRRDFEMFASAFPDMHLTVEDVIAEGDQIAARYYWTGTHRGEFAGIAPTGKMVHVRGLDIWRMRDGKCIEHWNIEDNLSLMEQLGALLPPQ